MSQPNVVVRYDVTGSQVVVTENQKIAKSFDALRTSGGQVTSSVQQMQQGFRSDILGNFGNSVTNANTKITSFREKLGQVGTTFTQNATSFGVATASIWGVYNAYDSLEKVQIRAHAAAQRVSTLETTIATLTERRRQAVEKGNLSAEQMAILDERITNAHGKLAVAQERNSDLQQDVNEAWAAFASQVGPQVVAAGASVTQLVTNMKGSMTGILPSIKGMFGAFSGGPSAMNAVKDAGLSLNPVLGGMQKQADNAGKSFTLMGGAMKGIVAGGIVAAIGGAFAAFVLDVQQTQRQLAILQAELKALPQGTVESFNKMIEAADTFLNSWEGQWAKIVSAVVPKGLTGPLAERGDFIAQWIETLRGGVASANNAKLFAEVRKDLLASYNENFVNSPEMKLIGVLPPEKQAEIKANMAKMLGFIKGDVNWKDKAFAETTLKVATPVAEGITEALAGIGEKIATGQVDFTSFLQDKFFNADVADAANVVIKEFSGAITTLGLSFSQIKPDVETAIAALVEHGDITAEEVPIVLALVESHLKSKEAKVQDTKATEDLAKEEEAFHEKLREEAITIRDKARAEQEENRIKQEAIQVQQNLVAQTFGQAEANQVVGESTTAYHTRLDQLSGIVTKRIQEENSYTLGLIETAVQMGLNETMTNQLAVAMHTGDEALIKLITSGEALNQVFNDMERQNKNTWAGMLEGRQKILDLVDATDRAFAANVQYRKDLQQVMDMAGVKFPAMLDSSTANMELFTKAVLGDVDAQKQLKEVMKQTVEEAFGPFDQKLSDLISKWSDKEGRGKLKDFMEKVFPKDIRKEVQLELDFAANEQKTKDRLEFFIATLTKPDPNNPTLLKVNPQLDETEIDDMLKKWRKDLKKRMEKEDLGPDSLSGIFLEKINQALEKIKNGENPLVVLQDLFNDPELRTALAAAGEDNPFTGAVNDQIDMMSIDEDTKAKLKAAVQGLPGTTPIPVTIPLEPDIAWMAGKSGEGAKSEALEDFVSGGGSDDPLGIKKMITDATKDLPPVIVSVTADIEAFLKSASDVMNVTDAIDKLRPIVDFLGDHRQYMKAASDVLKVTAAIDKLRPIVDFLGDSNKSGNFTKVANDVIATVKKIDGMVATVTIKAKRVGNFSAQHGMHATLSEDAFIYAHKDERVDISPPHEQERMSSQTTHNTTTISGPSAVHIEMPIYLFPGAGMIKKLIKEIPLEDTGMYASA